jgi:hypothetical protein
MPIKLESAFSNAKLFELLNIHSCAVPDTVILPDVCMLPDKGILKHTALELVIPVLARI